YLLAERINQLGGKPDLNPDGVMSRAATEYVEGGNLVDMIKEDLIAERIAVETYREMVRYFGDKDPTTRVVLERILAQEEEHANDMPDLLVTDRRGHGPSSQPWNGNDMDTYAVELGALGATPDLRRVGRWWARPC